MVETILRVDGMMCGMCESHINDVVRKTARVNKVTSSHTKGETVIVSEQPVDVEALKAAIDELFALNYERVVCGAFEENKASLRVMEKAGMKKIEFTEIIEYRGVNHTCVYCETRKEN